MAELVTHHGVPEDADVRARWHAVVDADPLGTLFHTPEYLEVWAEELGTRATSMCTRSCIDGATVGIVPLALQREGSPTGPLEVVRFMGGTDVTDYPGPVAAPRAPRDGRGGLPRPAAGRRRLGRVRRQRPRRRLGLGRAVARRTPSERGLITLGAAPDDVCPRRGPRPAGSAPTSTGCPASSATRCGARPASWRVTPATSSWWRSRRPRLRRGAGAVLRVQHRDHRRQGPLLRQRRHAGLVPGAGRAPRSRGRLPPARAARRWAARRVVRLAGAGRGMGAVQLGVRRGAVDAGPRHGDHRRAAARLPPKRARPPSTCCAATRSTSTASAPRTASC